MDTLQTVFHAYRFDLREPGQREAWDAFRAEKDSTFPHCHGPVHSRLYWPDLDGQTLTLETAHVFENQWNASTGVDGSKGFRVFDWSLESEHQCGNSLIRQGHYLEQTPAMRELRRNTMACGYCGKQESAARGSVFCGKCIESPYLKESDLYLLRMRPMNTPFTANRPPLTAAERAHLVPLYVAAQTHGSTERGKARIAAERAKIANEYESSVALATMKRDGFTWLMDNGISLENVIFYPHAPRFSFGWRRPLGEAELSELIASLGSEFTFPYQIECADGRKLMGN